MSQAKNNIIPPDIYTKKYYLNDNEGHEEYLDLDSSIHDKFERALRLANIKEGENVLDVGCGRGELVYYALKKGANHALGIDYAQAAVDIAKDTINRLPVDLKMRAQIHRGEAESFPYAEKYDVIFFLEIAEHMHDWQLEQAFKIFHDLLSDEGRIIMITPNYLYERVLQPVKLICGIPGNAFKWPLRIIQDKYEPENIWDFLRRIFKIRIDRGNVSRRMHCNVLTPGRIRHLLADFDRTVYYEDESKNFLSMAMKKWWGRDIIAIAKK